MQILKLLSEEVFEVKDQMTAAKTKTLKERLNQEFAQIFQLCDYVLQNSQHPTLLNVTLQTLQRFLTWIPLGYIFETNLIALLITKFFPVPIFRNGAIECLTEIAGLTECPANYEATLVQLYQQFLTQLASFVAPDPRILTQLHETDGGDHSIKLLALFFSSFFKVIKKLKNMGVCGLGIRGGIFILFSPLWVIGALCPFCGQYLRRSKQKPKQN